MALFQQGMFQINPRDTPETIARKRALANQIMNGPAVAPRSTLDGVGNMFGSIMGGIAARNMGKKADAAEQAGMTQAGSLRDELIATITGGEFPAAPNPGNTTSMATMPAPDAASARVAQAHGDGDLRGGIEATASALGIDPVDLATAISYETAGTFDPTKRGPRTQWGQHRGLIQFGEPQAKKYGVDWDNPIGSQLGPDGAVAKYLRDTGVQPGMKLLDIYSAINAGGVGRYNRSDANNGGAPGTVRDKVEQQMAGHRAKAAAMFGSGGTPPAVAANEAMATDFQSNGLTPEMLQQWGAANYADPAAMQAGMGGGVPVAENEADILAQEAAMMGQDPMAFQQPGMQAPAPAQPMTPPMPSPQAVGGMPVSGHNVNPDMPMAGAAGNRTPPPGPSLQQLLQVVSSPFMDEGTKAYANALLQQQLQGQDPMRQLNMDYKRAQIGKLQSDASGPAELGLNPQYGVDAQGNPVLIQIGKDGKAVQTAMPDGVQLSKEPIRMDAGTHFVLLDPITRQPVGTVPKDNYQAAFETGAGGADAKSSAEARANLPKVEDNAISILSMIDSLDGDPYLESMVGPISGRLPNVSGDAARVQSKMDQIGGQAFLQAFETLRGGGQISNVEGQRATEALARLNTAQSPSDYRQALNELRGIVRQSLERARRSAGMGSGTSAPPGADGWQDMGGVRIRRKR